MAQVTEVTRKREESRGVEWSGEGEGRKGCVPGVIGRGGRCAAFFRHQRGVEVHDGAVIQGIRGPGRQRFGGAAAAIHAALQQRRFLGNGFQEGSTLRAAVKFHAVLAPSPLHRVPQQRHKGCIGKGPAVAVRRIRVRQQQRMAAKAMEGSGSGGSGGVDAMGRGGFHC